MSYKRDSFCGPAGNGKMSELISGGITAILDWLEIDLEDECHRHDIDWEDGPSTLDDIRFGIGVYHAVKDQKNVFLAGFLSLAGFAMVRGTAIAYKHF